MRGTFNTSDYDEEDFDEDDELEDDEDQDELDDEDYDEDGYGEDIDDGYGEDHEDPLENEDDPFGEEQKNSRSNTKKESKGKKGTTKTLFRATGSVQNRKPKFNAALAKKEAIKKGCSPVPEGICPGCHKRSIFKSYRPMDLTIFTGLVALVTFGSSRMSTFYCMNRRCKFSYWKNYCFRCAGDRWVGAKVPWKRISSTDV